MEYYFHNRGKYTECEQAIWNTSLFTSIIWGCTKSILTQNSSSAINIQSMPDEEFIVCIKEETYITENIVLIQI